MPNCIRCSERFTRVTEDTTAVPFGTRYCAPCLEVRKAERKSADVITEPIVETRERKSFVVAAYDVAMAFGGREEGGWWYDRGSLIRVLRVFPSEDKAYEYSRRLNTKLRSREFGPNKGRREYSSVLSDGEVRAITFEDTAPMGFPDRRPTYE